MYYILSVSSSGSPLTTAASSESSYLGAGERDTGRRLSV